jgi:hypothetical protein
MSASSALDFSHVVLAAVKVRTAADGALAAGRGQCGEALPLPLPRFRESIILH